MDVLSLAVLLTATLTLRLCLLNRGSVFATPEEMDVQVAGICCSVHRSVAIQASCKMLRRMLSLATLLGAHC